MGRKFLGNEYEVRGDITAIKLRRRDGTIIESIIDTADLEKVKSFNGSWYFGSRKTKSGTFYVQGHMAAVMGKRKFVALHRYIMDCPSGLVVDHINHDTMDNRRKNLRIVTSVQNGQNRLMAKNNTSGYTGVCWNKKAQKWRAYVRNGDDFMICGNYKDPHIAGRVASLVRSLVHPYSEDALKEENK